MTKRVECPEPGCAALASLGEVRCFRRRKVPHCHGTVECDDGHWFFMPLDRVNAGLVDDQVA